MFAHVTPTQDAMGNVIGYHSNRRVPERAAVETIIPIYRQLRTIESMAKDPRQGLADSYAALRQVLAEKNLEYDEFVFSI